MARILARLADTVKNIVTVIVSEYAAPFGPLAIATRGDVLVEIRLEGQPDRLAATLGQAMPATRGTLPASVCRAFDAYFSGTLQAIDTLTAEPAGTAFQQQVWTELRRIAAGTTLSYSQLAARVGRPEAVRAVGAANGRNPVPIVIPCHRVIGADGRLVGYGGGLDMKRWLLTHEGLMPGRLW